MSNKSSQSGATTSQMGHLDISIFKAKDQQYLLKCLGKNFKNGDTSIPVSSILNAADSYNYSGLSC